MHRLGLYPGRLPGFDKRGFDRRELIELVCAADACGYDSFWMPEAWERDAFTMLAELAVKTERLHLGAGIVNVFSRSPALIAMSAATLDELSGGRFRLGLGTSSKRVVEDFHGIKFDKPLTRLRETIQIIRLLMAGERVDFDGQCFQLARFKLGFRPLRAELPIYVAALAPQSLRQLGELADGWLPAHWPGEQISEGIAHIRAGAEAANRNLSHIEIAPMVNVVVSDDLAKARDRARLPIAYYVGGMGDFYYDSLARRGFAVEADRVRAAWQAGRRKEAIRAVTDEMVDRIAICGPVDVCRARLDELPASGATLPIIVLPAEGDTAHKIRILESLIQ
jgi:F420-dependent oxidoreductase-like protein